GLWRSEGRVFQDRVVVFSVLDWQARTAAEVIRYLERLKTRLKKKFAQLEILITVQELLRSEAGEGDKGGKRPRLLCRKPNPVGLGHYEKPEDISVFHLRIRMHTLRITNGRVIDPSQDIDQVADLWIRGEAIFGIGPQPSLQADRVLDAAGKIVCPGLI